MPVGHLTSQQASGLSEIAETYGNGELRFTVWQNVPTPNIADHDVDDVKRELDLLGLGDEASSFRAGLVACTGNAGCKFCRVRYEGKFNCNLWSPGKLIRIGPSTEYSRDRMSSPLCPALYR